MAVPKKKMSRMRTRHRKAQWKIQRPALVTCPRCRAPKLGHRVCPNCGTYKGRQVVEVD
ncbi:MAG: 50S ribosomal protein L32-1 [Acidimicrobiia bacterium]|nr:MAG: 50S ribosomal protein L32-1 [Acidimicrobiia bacterium]